MISSVYSFFPDDKEEPSLNNLTSYLLTFLSDNKIAS